MIDAEGHEASIIPSIDFRVVNPEAIYFESHNLGSKKTDVNSFLSRNGYEVIERLNRTSGAAALQSLDSPSRTPSC